MPDGLMLGFYLLVKRRGFYMSLVCLIGQIKMCFRQFFSIKSLRSEKLLRKASTDNVNSQISKTPFIIIFANYTYFL